MCGFRLNRLVGLPSQYAAEERHSRAQGGERPVDQQQERLSSAAVFPPHSSNYQFRLRCDRARSCRWRMSGRLLAVEGGQRLRDGETCGIYRPAGFVMNGNGHSLIQVA